MSSLKTSTLRVCLVTLDNPYFHSADGVARYTYFLSINLAKLGCEVHVLSLEKSQENTTFYKDGVVFHSLPSFRNDLMRSLLFLKKVATELLKYSGKNRFDVVHGQGSYAGAVALARCLGLKSKCIATIHTTGFDELIATSNDYFELSLYLNGLAAILSLPVAKFYGSFIYNQMDMNISVCEYHRHRASRVYDIPLEKIVTIPPGVDTVRLKNNMHQNNFQPHPQSLLYVGRLAPRKGVQYLLLAMPFVLRRFPNIKLNIVGDGPLRKNLETLSSSLGLQKNVQFLGHITDTDLHELYFNANAIIIPSLFEGLPIVLLEAMAAGKPIVASAVGGIPEVLKHNFSGLLVKPRDAQGIAKAIISILQDESFANYLSENAKQAAMSKYSWENCARKMLEVYENL